MRPIRIEGDVAFIPLTKGYVAMIDAADVPLVEGTTWSAQEHRRKDGAIRTVYAVRKVGGRKGRTVLLHRVLMGEPPELEVDHEDGDGLHCRRKNMRTSTRAQNGKNLRLATDNTSGFKGVWWHKQREKWAAEITDGGKKHPLGLFRCKAAAAIAYAKESQRLHGEFGRVA